MCCLRARDAVARGTRVPVRRWLAQRIHFAGRGSRIFGVVSVSSKCVISVLTQIERRPEGQAWDIAAPLGHTRGGRLAVLGILGAPGRLHRDGAVLGAADGCRMSGAETCQMEYEHTHTAPGFDQLATAAFWKDYSRGRRQERDPAREASNSFQHPGIPTSSRIGSRMCFSFTLVSSNREYTLSKKISWGQWSLRSRNFALFCFWLYGIRKSAREQSERDHQLRKDGISNAQALASWKQIFPRTPL